jgi:hypothetical protein
MGRAYDPARAMRERLRLLEQREAARGEARAVAEGVAETVVLCEQRGAAFAKAATRPGGRAAPYRRQAGLEWLAGKGRLSARQKAAGERYGDAYRRAAQVPSPQSTLEVQPGGSGGGPSVAMILRQGEGRRQAQARLAAYRERLFGQSDLVHVCDLVCGQELTPREAGGGDRHAARIEAVLKVALDILALD